MDNKTCVVCGAPAQYTEFTSKKGNFVRGWKCQNKECGQLEYLPSARGTSPRSTQPRVPPQQQPDWGAIAEEKDRKISRHVALKAAVESANAIFDSKQPENRKKYKALVSELYDWYLMLLANTTSNKKEPAYQEDDLPEPF